MTDEPIQLVIFDLGRVLIRLCDGWQHAAKLAGVTRLPCEVHELDEEGRAHWEKTVYRYDAGELDLHAFAREIALHRKVDPEDVIKLQAKFLLGAYPGAKELIHELSDRGIKTACLSNTADSHWKQCHDPNDPNHLPMDRLTWRFASHLIGHCKPNDAIYEHVEVTTRIRPRAIMFFDDMEANVLAATKRNWRAIQVKDTSDPIQEIRVHLKEHELPIGE